MGIDFQNRIGIVLSDKHLGNYFSSFVKFGFGFVEIDIINNSDSELILINRVNKLIVNIKNISRNYLILGAYIKSVSKNDELIFKYLVCMRNLYLYVDYIALSFNQVLTDKSIECSNVYLENLQRLKQEQKFLTESNKRYVPLVIEIAINLSEHNLLMIIHEIVKNDIDGIIISSPSVNIDNNSIEPKYKFIIENVPNNIPIFFKGDLQYFTDRGNIAFKNTHLFLLQDIKFYSKINLKNIFENLYKHKY
ncbi:MAG: hypothetical protein HRT87_05560 [Legionellales bacterium]|nr:hypothetical protein [Legionellales bacterium]